MAALFSPSKSLVILPLIAAPVLWGACTDLNSKYCEDDSVCQDPEWEHFDPLKPVCHPIGHMCYVGCQSDKDCTDSSAASYEPGRPFCNLSTGHCYAPGDDASTPDGGADFGSNLENGQPCSESVQCQSGRCTDGVCCDTLCSGICQACNLAGVEGTCTPVPAGEDPRKDCAGTDTACAGSCDGSGLCAYPGSDTSCKAPSCADGKLSTHACDAQGNCQAELLDCGGYTCSTSGDACNTTCSDESGCYGTFQCVNGTCVNELALGSVCGTNDNACKSKHCVDGVCCDSDCTAACMDCSLSGSEGTCSSLAGVESEKDCPGDPACGAGKCTAGGTCSYPQAGEPCGASICTAGSQTDHTCSATHICEESTIQCTPYTCDAAGAECLSGCLDHGGCIAASLCDRSSAHADADGLGICVDPAKVVTVGAMEEIADVLSQVSAAKPYVAIPPKGVNPYVTELQISGMTVHLVGKGTSGDPVILRPADINVQAIFVKDGATVTVQGMTVQDASGVGADGIFCQGTPSTKSTLTVLESTIKSNEGIGVKGADCDVVLRRNRIENNSAGGVKLDSGTFVVVNNLVVNNGKTSSSVIGGLSLSPEKIDGNTFYNNSVAYNGGVHISSGGGVKCMSNIDLFNNIIYFNGNSPLLGCTPKYSDVEFGGTTNNNIASPPEFVDLTMDDFTLKSTSPCIDKGTTTSGITTIDLINAKRLQGTQVDMGAYEIK